VARRRAKGPANPASRAWIVLLAVTFVLSLGLTLHGPNGQVQFDFPWGNGSLPLPGQLLFDWLPFYSSMRAYARFGLLVTLSGIVLAGIEWAYLLRYGGLRVRLNARWLTLAAITLLLVDLWTSPYSWGTTRVEPTEASRAIASAEPGLVMQMPLTASQSGPALWWGTYYDKPIAYGYETFEPPQWRAERPALGTFPDAPALDVLRKWGVRYIVVSANAYGADWPGTLEYLKTVPGLRHIEDFQEHRTWDVDPGVLDAQPELEQYALPDTLAVFELMP
jgi:hypothetical protein